MMVGETSDEAIAQAIRTRLTWDPEIEGATIAVTVAQGSVLLEGVVRGYQRAAAERIARETPGVAAVDNRLHLADPLHPGDETLAKLIATALTADPAIPAGQIGVTVHDGIVELRGEVNRGAERSAVEAAVLDLPGVVDVHNRVTVSAAPVEAEQIATTIQDTFVAEARAAARGIVAQVDGDRVTLTGTTPTPHYRQLAERAAWSVAGVSEVRNEIRVEP
jgi:osmotically-inducible protein OsmY